MSTTRHRVSRALGGALLNIAALGGLLCIVLVVLSILFGVSLIMFKTGSMSPTIPAGSLAVVREIPASEIEVGDVLTVDREGALPVTHRVTSVSGEGESRTITMRGDANEAEDPAPYTVTEVRKVLFAMPGLARVIVWFSNPLVLGSLTLLVSALVTWAFWPKDRGRPAASKGSPPRHGLPRHAAPGRGRAESPGIVGAGATLLALFVTAGLIGLPPAPAHAVPTEEVVSGEHLTLTSIRDTGAMRAMSPSAPVRWQVGASINGSETGRIALSLAASGSPQLGLTLETRACSERWRGAQCPGVEISAGGQGPVELDAGFVPLASGQQQLWLLISATVPEGSSGQVELTVLAAAQGEELVLGPDPVGELPRTGSDLGWAVLLSFAAVAGGIIVAGLAGRARRPLEGSQP